VWTIALVGLPESTAAAQPQERKQQVDAAITELQEEMVGTSVELQAAYGDLAATQTELATARSRLATAETDRAAAQSVHTDLTTRLTTARVAMEGARTELATVRRSAAQERAALGRTAGAMYRSGTAWPELGVMLGARSPDDLVDRYVFSSTVLAQRSGTVAQLQATSAARANAEARSSAVAAEVDALEADAATAASRAAEAAAAARARADELDVVQRRQAGVVEVITSRRAEEEARLTALDAEREALEAQIRQLAEEALRRAETERRAEAERQAARRAEAARRGAAPAAPAPAPPTPAPAAGDRGSVLSMPVQGRITSPFGYRVHPIYGTRRLHTGTDIGAPCGRPVRAAADGTVVSAGWAGGYGIRTVLDHGVVGGAATSTTYNHMSGLAVSGGRVSRGQVIGYVGTTGASTGCHLHFEAYRNGEVTDPMRLV
jgi:murein DD-endopeptidase MepM/ murein hydrolase activator NlpD